MNENLLQTSTSNIKEMKVFEHHLSFKTAQIQSSPCSRFKLYVWITGDMGGTIGLCLGGSLLTLFEIADLLIFTYFLKRKPTIVPQNN